MDPKVFPHKILLLQVTAAVWVSMLMSALAGIVAVCLMIATFYCIRYSTDYLLQSLLTRLLSLRGQTLILCHVSVNLHQLLFTPQKTRSPLILSLLHSIQAAARLRTSWSSRVPATGWLC